MDRVNSCSRLCDREVDYLSSLVFCVLFCHISVSINNIIDISDEQVIYFDK
jgi:hypothetical protein